MDKNPKYLNELKEDTLRKDIIYACEAAMVELEQDSEETKELLMHEKMFNSLSIA